MRMIETEAIRSWVDCFSKKFSKRPQMMDDFIRYLEKRINAMDADYTVVSWTPFIVLGDGTVTNGPDIDDEFLISDGIYVWSDCLAEDGKHTYTTYEVIRNGMAWMPMPKAYRGTDNEID